MIIQRFLIPNFLFCTIFIFNFKITIMPSKNSLIEKLEQGKNVYGTCITSTAPMWPGAIKSAGLDFVFIDTEHIPLGPK